LGKEGEAINIAAVVDLTAVMVKNSFYLNSCPNFWDHFCDGILMCQS